MLLRAIERVSAPLVMSTARVVSYRVLAANELAPPDFLERWLPLGAGVDLKDKGRLVVK